MNEYLKSSVMGLSLALVVGSAFFTSALCWQMWNKLDAAATVIENQEKSLAMASNVILKQKDTISDLQNQVVQEHTEFMRVSHELFLEKQPWFFGLLKPVEASEDKTSWWDGTKEWFNEKYEAVSSLKFCTWNCDMMAQVDADLKARHEAIMDFVETTALQDWDAGKPMKAFR